MKKRRSTKEPLFLYVKIPAPVMPTERSDDFEEPLDEALQAAGVGEVTGGGTALSDGGDIEYAGIDVEATDLEAALALIRRVLRKQGAPKGTVIEHGEESYGLSSKRRPAKKSSGSRKARKIDIAIGDWFDVPLPSGGHAVGIVSRLNVKQYGAFCYFFGPRRKSVWTEKQVRKLEPDKAVFLGRISILGFSHGDWNKVTSEADFDPKYWIMPPFLTGFKDEGFVPGMMKVWYPDDLTRPRRWQKATAEDMWLPEDCCYGYVSVEEELERLL